MQTISQITSSKLSGLTVVQLRSIYVKANEVMMSVNEWKQQTGKSMFPSLVSVCRTNELSCLKDFYRLTGFDSWIGFSGAHDMAKLRCDFEGVS